MKKIFAIALAVMLVMSMGTTAFAAEYIGSATVNDTDGTSFDVYGRYLDLGDVISVISVDVEYGAMSFVYTEEQAGIWNPATHEYTAYTNEGAWEVENDSNHLIVTNHSNVMVQITVNAEANELLAYPAENEDGEEYYIKGFILTNETENSWLDNDGPVYLDAGIENGYADADYVDITIVPSNDSFLDPGYNDPNTIIGTVTVTVSDAT